MERRRWISITPPPLASGSLVQEPAASGPRWLRACSMRDSAARLASLIGPRMPAIPHMFTQARGLAVGFGESRGARQGFVWSRGGFVDLVSQRSREEFGK